MAVQDGLVAVGAGPGSGGGASVDIGDGQAYLHSLTALSRSRDVFLADRFYSLERRLLPHPTVSETVTLPRGDLLRGSFQTVSEGAFSETKLTLRAKVDRQLPKHLVRREALPAQ